MPNEKQYPRLQAKLSAKPPGKAATENEQATYQRLRKRIGTPEYDVSEEVRGGEQRTQSQPMSPAETQRADMRSATERQGPSLEDYLQAGLDMDAVDPQRVAVEQAEDDWRASIAEAAARDEAGQQDFERKEAYEAQVQTELAKRRQDTNAALAEQDRQRAARGR